MEGPKNPKRAEFELLGVAASPQVPINNQGIYKLLREQGFFKPTSPIEATRALRRMRVRP